MPPRSAVASHLGAAAALVGACSPAARLRATTAPTTPDRSSLTYWTWAPNMDKVVDDWNADAPEHPGHRQQAGRRRRQVTKLLTAIKAGSGAPDLIQAEYQKLPTLVCNDALADISRTPTAAQGRLRRRASGSTVTLGSDARLRDPAGLRPDDVLLPQRPLPAVRPDGPEDLGRVRGRPREHCRPEDPKQYLTTFSATDPGWFAGPRPAGRRLVVGHQRRHLERRHQRRRPPRRSPTTGAAWSRRASSTTSRCTPRSGTRRSTTAPRSAGSAPSGARACSRATRPTPRASGRWRRCRSGTPATTAPAAGAARPPR